MAWKDYEKAGFKLLPSNLGPTKFTALQAIIFQLLLLPATLLPFVTGMCSYNDLAGVISLLLIVLANIFMILRCVMLYKKLDIPSARKVMFGSYMYLPVILLALYISKV